MNLKNTFLLICLTLLCGFALNAQELEFPGMDASPMDAAHYPGRAAFPNYLDDAPPLQVKVLYCRPQKKDRVIFGGLVPYGELWRLGANEATEVSFFQPVEIGGKAINAGTYTMFAEVHPNNWVIVISTQRFVAGTSNLDASQRVASVSIPVTNLKDSREAFTIGFQRINDEKCNMIFEWDRTRATLPISFNPANLSNLDASPMDLAQYPSNSRFTNFVEDAEKAKVRVVYSRPQKKGRTIFGELVKYGEPWRLGANETTEITFFEDVKIGGSEVKAGRYGILANVEKDNWEFVIHSNIPSWGAHNHDEKKNVAKVSVPVTANSTEVEALSVVFDKKDDKNVDMVVAWDKTLVRMPIELK